MKNKAYLTVIIPTCNHPKNIEEIFLNICDDIKKYDIIVEVHDSSISDDTKQIVNIFSKTNSLIRYFRYDNNINIDLKTILALKKCETEYLYLCGDKCYLNLNKIEVINRCFLKDYSVIEMYDSINSRHFSYYEGYLKKKYGCEEIVYSDAKTYVKENIWHLPYYGGSIAKSELFKNISLDDIDDMIGSGFIYPYIIANTINRYKKMIVLGGDFVRLVNCAGESGWIVNREVFKIWAVNFPNSIMKIANLNMSEKKDIIIYSERKLRFFDARFLIYCRTNGNFNLSIFLRHRLELKTFSNNNIFILFLIAIIPSNFWIVAKKMKKTMIKN